MQAEFEKGLKRGNALSFIQQWLDGEMLSRHKGQWVLNSFLPPFPGVAFDRMFENLLSGRRLSPVSANLAITHECPLNCWHCSYKNRQPGSLPADDWLSIIRGLHSIGVSIIGFTGGEPLLRSDLPSLVRAASSGGAATIVFSSGTTLNAEKVRELKDAGLWALCVSLDHPDADVCDTLRGSRNVYHHAINALKLARAAGFYTMMGSVATRRLLDQNHHEALLSIARENKVHELRFVEPMPCGRLSSRSEDVFLSADHINKLRAFHVRENRKGRLPKVCAFNQIESPELFGCGAGTQHLFVDAAGAVCPCDFTPLSFGNAGDEPLAQIWSRMSEAMNNPRRNCFIQKHHALIQSHSQKGYPLPLEISTKICAQAEKEPLPDYFALVTGQAGNDGDDNKQKRSAL